MKVKEVLELGNEISALSPPDNSKLQYAKDRSIRFLKNGFLEKHSDRLDAIRADNAVTETIKTKNGDQEIFVKDDKGQYKFSTTGRVKLAEDVTKYLNEDAEYKIYSVLAEDVKPADIGQEKYDFFKEAGFIVDSRAA